jgi:hypothetical protein
MITGDAELRHDSSDQEQAAGRPNQITAQEAEDTR